MDSTSFGNFRIPRKSPDERFFYRNTWMSREGFWDAYPHTERRVFAIMRRRDLGQSMGRIAEAFGMDPSQVDWVIRIYRRLPKAWQRHGVSKGGVKW